MIEALEIFGAFLAAVLLLVLLILLGTYDPGKAGDDARWGTRRGGRKRQSRRQKGQPK